MDIAAGAGSSLITHEWGIIHSQERLNIVPRGFGFGGGGGQRGLQECGVLLKLKTCNRRTNWGNAGGQAHVVVVASVPDTAALVRVQQAAERAIVVLADLQGQRTSLQAPTCSREGFAVKLELPQESGVAWSSAGLKDMQSKAEPNIRVLPAEQSPRGHPDPRGELLGWQHKSPLHLSHGAARLSHLGPEGLVDLLAPTAQVEGQGAGGNGAPDPAGAALAADFHLDLPVPRVGRVIL